MVEGNSLTQRARQAFTENLHRTIMDRTWALIATEPDVELCHFEKTLLCRFGLITIHRVLGIPPARSHIGDVIFRIEFGGFLEPVHDIQLHRIVEAIPEIEESRHHGDFEHLEYR